MNTPFTALLFITGVLFGTLTQAFQLPAPLVESDWLAKNQDKVLILDVRQDLKSFSKEPVFKKDEKSGKKKLVAVGGHMPGASLVNYKQVRVTRKIGAKEVTRMLPEKADFEKLMQAAGVNKNSAVVIVSKGDSNSDTIMTTRLYWQLKYFGHNNLAILNGGMAQWIDEGRAVSFVASKMKKGNWTASAKPQNILATSDDVAKAVKDGSAQLVDTRSLAQYLGTWRKSYVYKDGHIPGAKVFPNELITAPSAPARFTASEKLTQLAAELGIKSDQNLITYCNSGHLASGSWFVFSELMGNKNAKLYDGSAHQWTLEDRPTSALKME